MALSQLIHDRILLSDKPHPYRGAPLTGLISHVGNFLATSIATNSSPAALSYHPVREQSVPFLRNNPSRVGNTSNSAPVPELSYHRRSVRREFHPNSADWRNGMPCSRAAPHPNLVEFVWHIADSVRSSWQRNTMCACFHAFQSRESHLIAPSHLNSDRKPRPPGVGRSHEIGGIETSRDATAVLEDETYS